MTVEIRIARLLGSTKMKMYFLTTQLEQRSEKRYRLCSQLYSKFCRTGIKLKCDESVSVENSKLTFVSENPSNNYVSQTCVFE